MLFFLLLSSSVVWSQEARSKTVEFKLNNSADLLAPEIVIHSPSLVEGESFLSEEGKIEILGEVKDASKIRFVAINTDVMMVDASGIFASSLSLIHGENKIRVKSMDEHSNIREVEYVINYVPPVVTLADRIKKDSKYYGLIIGIDSYEDEGFDDLDNPVRDAEDVYRTLTREYTFEPENVKLLKDPGRADIIRELDLMRSRVKEDDNLLIFYAGHGYWDTDAKVGYWLPSDASRQTTADWFRNSTLVDYLQAIKSKHTLLITDACFAGSIFKTRSVDMDTEVVYEQIYEIQSRKAMTSGALTEVPDNSAFVKYLVRRLDDNKETYLSSEELFGSFKKAVLLNGEGAVPRYGEIKNVGDEGGDFIFLKREYYTMVLFYSMQILI